ncbi:enoyl-CoA hydratase/isomerase family protein [Tabrizicola piscis]|uniref:Enoyl-CoA hydratase/isomerase family protein n=2 Tax=Tabrizicola piscis TaxID=2494374 RepID=A0A3S8U6Y7_9RHOB|nr:enoyl-CoA hydratase/isomerase family protein [Tabrizicola piscis]AZL59315.1 enoyl-CoA hydratase/isomerase family protein [Tabrizicola piscis]
MMIKAEVMGSCCILRLARSEKANALTGAMLQDLRAAIVSAGDSGAKALILTGEGRVFSAGADLDEMANGLGTSPAWEALSGSIATFPGLTIAALNGTLAGGATGMALACDIRIAVPTAQFFYPVMRLGYLPQPSDPARLTEIVGPGRARMILLAGQRIGADEALAWGLIDRITPPEALMDTAMALAADALAADQTHVAALARLARGDQA